MRISHANQDLGKLNPNGVWPSEFSLIGCCISYLQSGVKPFKNIYHIVEELIVPHLFYYLLNIVMDLDISNYVLVSFFRSNLQIH